MREHEAPEPERHDEHHEPHAGRDAEQARQTSDDAYPRARGGQHDVARPRRDRAHDGEEKERDDLVGCHTLASWLSKKPDRPEWVLNDRARTTPRAGWPARGRPPGSSSFARGSPGRPTRNIATTPTRSA